jgi:uncharacterized small protein (DUF1192 family)
MKFTKLNINDFLIIKKISDFNNRLYFYNNRIIAEGTFSNYCIGITYLWNSGKWQHINNNKFIYPHPEPRSGYDRSYSELYDVLVDNIEDNIVYSYYSFSKMADKENWLLSKKEAKENIGVLQREIERIKKLKTKKGLKEAEEKLVYSETNYMNNYSKDIENLLREDTIKCAINTNVKYFLFNNNLYICSTEKEPYRYTQEQLELLLKESIYKEDLKFNKLKKQIDFYEKFSLNDDSEKKREPISEEVRAEVWRRDGGKCVICGSNEKLEFDHIIPFSKGGGNTVRNLQLLCEPCNRKKSDKI